MDARAKRANTWLLWTGAPALVVLALAGAACGTGFDPQSLVDSVRILASQADHPYATPGQTVTLQVLAYDGRPIQPAPMKVWWLPVVCTNPQDDLYYACFSSLAGGADAGAGAGDAGANPLGAPDGGGASGLGMLQPGVELTPFLVEGTSFTFTLRSDIISSHPPVPNQEPYGLAIAFNIACAGHVELLPLDASSANPLQVPVGCFDANHNPLDPSDYVIGFTRVYAYATWTNANPVISQVTFNGDAVPDGGIQIPHCTASKRQSCPGYALDTVVPSSSWEPDPGDIGQDGNPRHEEIWVDYYTTQGALDDDARLLYDAVQGGQTDTATKLHAPQVPGPGMVWAIAHDNRGGAAWQAIPVQVQ
jgi:hypothetical protein